MPSRTKRPVTIAHRNGSIATRKAIPPNVLAAFENNTPVPRNKKNKKKHVQFPNLPNQSHLGRAPNSGANESGVNERDKEARYNDPFIRRVLTQRWHNGKISRNGVTNISGLKRWTTENEARQHAEELHQHLNSVETNNQLRPHLNSVQTNKKHAGRRTRRK